MPQFDPVGLVAQELWARLRRKNRELSFIPLLLLANSAYEVIEN